MEEIDKLSTEEKEKLYKIPVLISILAAGKDGEIEKEEKAESLRLVHIKSYKAPLVLRDFYAEVEERFVNNFDSLVKELPKDITAREKEIDERIAALDPLVDKVGERFSIALKKSLKNYAYHVSKVHRNVLEYFILPLNIPGITD